MSDPSSEAVKEKDIEAGMDSKHMDMESSYIDARHGSIDDEVAHARAIQTGIAPLRFLRRGEEWLDEKVGVETRGIDRIPEDEKRPPSILNSFFLWFSFTLHVGTLPIGVLGPEFGLTLNQSVAAIVVGSFLGSLCTGYCGTLGPKVSTARILVKFHFPIVQR